MGTGEARLDASARVQIVQDFLRQRLAEALPLEAVLWPRTRLRSPCSRAGSKRVRFANILPEHLGAGLYLMELALAEVPRRRGGGNLVLRWQPLDLRRRAPSARPSRRSAPARGVDALELAYFGSFDPRLPPDWWPQWQGQEALPGLVRVQVRPPRTTRAVGRSSTST